MSKPGDPFVPAATLVAGIFAWAQLPAVCGFMLSSTLAGPGNYVYSIWLGALIAVVGLGTGVPSFLRGRRHPLLLAGLAACIGFFVFGVLAHGAYDVVCRAVYDSFD